MLTQIHPSQEDAQQADLQRLYHVDPGIAHHADPGAAEKVDAAGGVEQQPAMNATA